MKRPLNDTASVPRRGENAPLHTRSVLCGVSFLAPLALLAQGTPLPPPTRPTYASLTIYSPGPGPQNVRVSGWQIESVVAWDAPIPGQTGVTCSVHRWKEDDLACCNAQVAGLTGTRWLDESAVWPGPYIYRVVAFMPDGRVGITDVRHSPPAPVNPARFTGTVIGANRDMVWLQWDPVWNVGWYQLEGPHIPWGSFQLVNLTVFRVDNLPPGTYTWTIASAYSTAKAGPAISPVSARPRVTVIVP